MQFLKGWSEGGLIFILKKGIQTKGFENNFKSETNNSNN
jgi:hypothetical protein